MPSFTWLDDSIEHSDYDSNRAAAIAAKITSIERTAELTIFAQQADYESGYDYDSAEDCECEYCLAHYHHCDEEGAFGECSLCATPCTLQECATLAAFNAEATRKQAEADLEMELLQDKLAAIGARMMRPYEHWNEDEQYMQYMESRYDS